MGTGVTEGYMGPPSYVSWFANPKIGLHLPQSIVNLVMFTKLVYNPIISHQPKKISKFGMVSHTSNLWYVEVEFL